MGDRRGGRLRRALRIFGWGVGIVALLVAVLVIEMWSSLGARPSGARLERIQQSPRHLDGKFVNTLPMVEPEMWPALVEWIKGAPNTAPKEPPPIVARRRADFDAPPKSGLRITWLGHSTMLIEIDGRRFLTDPVWAERSSPSRWYGPKRFHAPPLSLDELPDLDAVVISHDHYDHLDTSTIRNLASREVPFVTPLGVGAHLEAWGIAETRITELDWWEETTIGGVQLTATPARHFSGRGVLDRDTTLWAGWALAGPEHRVFFSGDTGFFPEFADIGKRLGPFDATMIEVGAYNQMWGDVHLGPEQAVTAHKMLRGDLMFPVHWGTFDLALHAWTEPAERLMAAAEARGARVVIPKAGESVEPKAPPALTRWWPDIPWQRASDAPVVSSNLDEAVIATILGVAPAR